MERRERVDLQGQIEDRQQNRKVWVRASVRTSLITDCENPAFSVWDSSITKGMNFSGVPETFGSGSVTHRSKFVTISCQIRYIVAPVR